MESDFHADKRVNIMFKHVHDTSMLVPENPDIPLSDEFSLIKLWAKLNGLIIDIDNTIELVLHRPHLSKQSPPVT